MNSSPPAQIQSASSTGLVAPQEWRNRGVLNPRSYVILLPLLCGWLLVSYLAVSWFVHKRLDDSLRHHSEELSQTLAAVTYQFERSLAFLNTIPATIADDREKVFDKFYQVKARLQGHVHSSGLGLAFCKLAVEAHGGRIGLEVK